MGAPTSIRINYSNSYGSTQLPATKKGKKSKKVKLPKPDKRKKK